MSWLSKSADDVSEESSWLSKGNDAPSSSWSYSPPSDSTRGTTWVWGSGSTFTSNSGRVCSGLNTFNRMKPNNEPSGFRFYEVQDNRWSQKTAAQMESGCRVKMGRKVVDHLNPL